MLKHANKIVIADLTEQHWYVANCLSVLWNSCARFFDGTLGNNSAGCEALWLRLISPAFYNMMAYNPRIGVSIESLTIKTIDSRTWTVIPNVGYRSLPYTRAMEYLVASESLLPHWKGPKESSFPSLTRSWLVSYTCKLDNSAFHSKRKSKLIIRSCQHESSIKSKVRSCFVASILRSINFTVIPSELLVFWFFLIYCVSWIRSI
jgi:hypothetical protein